MNTPAIYKPVDLVEALERCELAQRQQREGFVFLMEANGFKTGACIRCYDGKIFKLTATVGMDYHVGFAGLRLLKDGKTWAQRKQFLSRKYVLRSIVVNNPTVKL